MSIKIYQAWRIEGVTTMPQALAWGAKLRTDAERLMHNTLREAAEKSRPKRKSITKHYVDSFWSHRVHKLLAETLCPKLEIIFIPSRRGSLLMAFFGRTYDYGSCIEANGAKFWGYWNNVDPDENCSDKEWEQRESDWTEVLEGNAGIPCEIGLSLTVIGQYLPLPQTLWPPKAEVACG